MLDYLSAVASQSLDLAKKIKGTNTLAYFAAALGKNKVIKDLLLVPIS
jgi:hypothetical protein